MLQTLNKLGRLFLLFTLSWSASAGTLNSIQVKPEAGAASIKCVVTGHPAYHVFTLHQPERLVIDLPNTTTSLNVKQIHLDSNIVRHMRIGHPNPQTLRLVFELVRPAPVNIRVKPAYIAQQLHLQIPLKSTTPSQPAHYLQTSNASSSSKPVQAPHMPLRTLRDVVVVIDPGHGGHDPGAMGMRHTYEKQIVLAIALKLKQLIDQQPGMRAVLTRTGDYYVGLRDRMHLARKYNGDIFVAIHADAFGNRASHGASVFALSQRGATSEAARWLAEKENYSELGGVNLSELDDQNGAVRSVLIDLSQTATISASLQMGGQVLRHLNQITALHSHKVEQARFMVLKSPDIPSVLIETGFISNPGEEAKLTNPAYQMRLCQAIMGGIKAYFWDYPPHGSRIEALSGGNRRLLTQKTGNASLRSMT